MLYLYSNGCVLLIELHGARQLQLTEMYYAVVVCLTHCGLIVSIGTATGSQLTMTNYYSCTDVSTLPLPVLPN